MITHLCRTCATPVDVARIDITTIAGPPTFTWGRYEQCSGCGSTDEPMEVIDANDKALGRGQWESR